MVLCSMINLGIIGPGLIWEVTHRDIIAQLSNRFRVVAVSARSEKNQQRGRDAYPNATIYASADDLIADPTVEAVVILTPIALNAPLARKTLEAGKHAIVEKPLARSVAEAREVIAAAHEGGPILHILEQHVHKPLVATIRDAIHAGEIGTPVGFERSVHNRIAETDDQTGGFGGTAWRQHPDFPIGIFFDGGIHEVALLHEIFGPATAVYARGRSLRDTFGDVDLLHMVIEYDRDIRGQFTHSTLLGAQRDYFVIRGTEAELLCTNTALTRIDGTTGESRTIEVPQGNESVTMWEEAATAITEGRFGRYTPEKAIADLALMEAIERSLSSAKREAVT
jgi:scyllo-inositol 2-dehydrogenase (NADP+)